MRNAVLVLLGAAAGGALGYYAFFWTADQGYYGIMLPGGLLGLGAGIAKNPSRWLAAACAVFALALGLFTEWQFAPFTKDESFTYFLLHVHQLQPITLLMIAIGAAIAFWVPFRRMAIGARKTSGTTP
jgi:hypothetical protein